MVLNIFDNEYVRCDLDDAIPVLRHYWKFELPGEQFRIQVQHVLEEYEKHKNNYKELAWLADTTNLGELDDFTDQWLITDWEDMLFKNSGVHIHAVILGASIYADYPMEKFKMDAEEKFRAYNVHLGVFSNGREAYTWIIENLKNL